MQNQRKPWVAVVLNLLLPGLGHVYMGKAVTAVILFAVAIIIGNVAYAIFIYSDAAPFNVLAPILFGLVWWIVLILVSIRSARLTADGFTPKAYNKWYLYLTLFVAAVIFAAFTVPFFGHYETYHIPSRSMEEALQVGDFIVADHSAYDSDAPNRHDVVVFIFPVDGVTKYVERCVGLPGDTVEIKNKELHINGRAATSPTTVKFTRAVVNPSGPGGKDSHDNFGPYVVPPDSYFMLGDNRDNSYDSRFWGSVSRELILGKAIRVYWSKDWGRIGRRSE